MRTVLLAASLAAVAAAASADPKPTTNAAALQARPVIVAPPSATDWRTPDPANIMVVDTNKGRIIVELTPEIAPQNAARLHDLAHENFYDGLKFFRVIDKFMDQTGDPQNTGVGGSTKPNVPAEFLFRRGAELPFALAVDQTVAEVGFVKSVPVMSQSMALSAMTKDQKVSAWPLYCPGVVGIARDSSPDSANSQFFFMRDAYPALEKRYTAVGRVISGQETVRAIKIGEPPSDPQDHMDKVRLLADMPEKDRPKVRVIDPQGPWFKAEIARVRAMKGADFSACDVNIPVEVK